MTRVDAPPRTATPVRRRLELTIAGIGAALALALQGGFAMVVAGSEPAELRDAILPAADAAGVRLPAGGEAEALQTLAGWFGFSLIAVLALVAIGWFFARIRPNRRSTGWWFLGAGLACLAGTQLVLYPVAFFFLLTAALFAARSPDGSPQ